MLVKSYGFWMFRSIGTCSSHHGNPSFPPWESIVPTMGIHRSHHGNPLFPPWESIIPRKETIGFPKMFRRFPHWYPKKDTCVFVENKFVLYHD